ncbi:formate dehydrogenase accessory sulfurtransferase FdhD [Phycicoccus endophyticus]|uniref:Sulfur carrier protein FdhD n=1 Tax=Phycicoccus endophyticus TaxID=1690220 RepID=A0A7G9R3Z8_9MICO|nr:formate dehydrogenase accessory sulfurtransferase FdhD [Phycicoccus endophyticus]NHI18162.1 formate dehydrogenase accessory sulfurtransferase FdhD [Phycicoccus endophyticus]QNN50323.1 formate dehydrogenase accessory sulfurtransferase FdhD [Phycicoccus endophyticus]GGL25977.1 sulfurtransferase FdhD [Phycicoccus endophyticus]
MGRVTTRVPRTRVDVERGAVVARPDTVAVEEPLELRVGGRPVTTTMRTPGDDFDLALGHLLTEGMLAAAADVATMMHCTDVGPDGSPTFNVVEAALAPGVELLRPARERTETMSSACGVCGAASLDAVRTVSRFDVGADPVSLDGTVLAGLPDLLRTRQPAFERTGGVHAAGLATAAGELLVVREDVGRHNAVDKVVGACARERPLPLSGTVLVVSARASFELVQKAAVAGVPALVAVGAPTSLAVELAVASGLTLAAFTRGRSFSLYSRPDRVRTPG